MFGGREGDGKKRIVNDIFIFDTGKYFALILERISIFMTGTNEDKKRWLTNYSSILFTVEKQLWF